MLGSPGSKTDFSSSRGMRSILVPEVHVSAAGSKRSSFSRQMAERHPSCATMVWEEVGAPQESSSPPEPCEVSTAQPLQIGETLPEENSEHLELQPGQNSESSLLLSSLDSSDTMVFGEHLQPSQRMDVLLVAIEAMMADDVDVRQMGRDIVDMAVRAPASWLLDVPKIMRYIHKSVEHIRRKSAQKRLDSLLLELTKWSPREVVRSLLRISPTCDRAAMAMWEVMISVPWTLGNVLMELFDVLQDCRVRKVFSSVTEDACIYPLSLLAYADIDAEAFAALYKAQRYLRRPSPVMLSLVLTGLVTLSKTPETARKLTVLLPDVLETLTDANADVKTKALVLFINMMGHMKREEANLISLRLAEELLPLFDDESNRLREVSIRLFKDVIKTAVGRNKKKMVKKVRSALLPLFFHMSDVVENVAKASRDTLSACGEFLGWRKLSFLAETWQTHRIGECLITHDRSRVDEYLLQSLPYLKDRQATLREVAITFIGLAVRGRRILRQEKLSQVWDALLPLREDTELSVSSLAAETISVLTAERSPLPRWSLRSLCCWLC
ncbi:uncharacterized protein LOC141916700 isoform X2 [Strix aluco]|uniref:uncharacterized protein LOC141916700 isoform X2 n=1 Tax=Strix aluco TaxID=111821 RepID=UPI003DA41F62